MEDNDKKVVISIRRSHASIIVPGSAETSCSMCEAETYTAPSGMAVVSEGGKVICDGCFCDGCFIENLQEITSESEGIRMAPGAVEELRAALKSEAERN